MNVANATSFSNTFTNCKKLENITFTNETIRISLVIPSAVLSDESIQSIFDGLANLTGQNSQILTLNKVLEEKITDEQIAYVVSKNWQLAFS